MRAPIASCLVALACVLAWAAPARAGLGPKPTMTFAFTFDRPALTIASGVLLESPDATCAKPEPLRQLGPQGFKCEATTCAARAYGFSPYARLQVTLSDGRTLTSAAFRDSGFNANYRAAVAGSALKVTSRWW